jgi:hypothetical protein
MKNRVHIVLGVLLVAAVGGLLWWSPCEPRDPPEPVYDGKPIGHWLVYGSRQVETVSELVRLDQDPLMVHSFSENKPANWQQRLFADSNAVPFLIKGLRRDTWFGAALYRKQVWPCIRAGSEQSISTVTMGARTHGARIEPRAARFVVRFAWRFKLDLF